MSLHGAGSKNRGFGRGEGGVKDMYKVHTNE